MKHIGLAAVVLSICAVIVLLTVGCEQQIGVKVVGTSVDPVVDSHGRMPFKVNNWIERLKNAPDGEPAKRKSAATAVARSADNPELTSEMRAQLVEALHETIEAEPTSDASDEWKQDIVAEANKALAALAPTH